MLPIPTPEELRQELTSFYTTGWSDYVLKAGGWWFEGDKLKTLRRQNLPQAFNTLRLRICTEISSSNSLLRTLLLPDVATGEQLKGVRQDFGIFWTLDRGVAFDFKPRRCYQDHHPMPDKGEIFIVEISDIKNDDIDWVATVGCQITNPMLREIRLKPGILKAATHVFHVSNPEGELTRSIPAHPYVKPVPEGPGFLDNFRALNQIDPPFLSNIGSTI